MLPCRRHTVPLPSSPTLLCREDDSEASSSSTTPSPPEKPIVKPIVSSASRPTDDQNYRIDEDLLNDFIKIHPMLSLEATSHKTLQLLTNATRRACVEIPDPPVVGKSYEDSFLRPANKDIGERGCICKDKCLCLFLARVRYGRNNNFGFVGTEWLRPWLPSHACWHAC